MRFLRPIQKNAKYCVTKHNRSEFLFFSCALFWQVNPCKLKKVTNVRSVLADESFKIAPPVRLGTEELIAYMGEDEMLEITPVAIRLRKAALDPGERQRAQRSKKKQK